MSCTSPHAKLLLQLRVAPQVWVVTGKEIHPGHILLSWELQWALDQACAFVFHQGQEKSGISLSLSLQATQVSNVRKYSVATVEIKVINKSNFPPYFEKGVYNGTVFVGLPQRSFVYQAGDPSTPLVITALDQDFPDVMKLKVLCVLSHCFKLKAGSGNTREGRWGEANACCPLLFHVIFPWKFHRYQNHLWCDVMGRSCWTPLFQSQSHTDHLHRCVLPGQVLKLPTQAGLRLGNVFMFLWYILGLWATGWMHLSSALLPAQPRFIYYSPHMLIPQVFWTNPAKGLLGRCMWSTVWFDHPLSGLSENQPQHRVLSQKQHRLHRNQGWAYPDQRGAAVPRNCDHPGRAPFLGVLSGVWKEGGIQILFLLGSKEAVNNFRFVRSWMFPLSTCLPNACLAQWMAVVRTGTRYFLLQGPPIDLESELEVWESLSHLFPIFP